ncbi:serralysin family metalloprotease [Pseudomonas azotoformans]
MIVKKNIDMAITQSAPAPTPPSTAFEQMQAFGRRHERVPGQDVNGKPSLTHDQAGEQINLKGRERWPDRDGDGKATFSYSFAKRPGATFNQLKLIGFSEFNPEQKAQMRLSLQSWSDVANVKFTEKENDGTGDGHLRFGNFQEIEGVKAPDGKAVTQYDPEGHEQQAWFRVGGYDANRAPKVNSRGRNTFTHEAGHQIGLFHPGKYNGSRAGYEKAAEYGQDTQGHSVMSYWEETHTGQDFSKKGKQYYASAPQMDDIVAAQQLYGPNTQTRKGDTVYGFGSNTGRDYYTVKSASDPLVASIWDGGGHDTLNLSGYRDDQKINLNAGSYSDVGGMKGNLSIAPGVVIEDAVGGVGNDWMLGNSAANSLKGGPGDDVIDGGAGQDELWGGSGKDVFLFSDASHSTPDAPDRIMDFRSGEDKIDVSSVRFASGQPELKHVEVFTGRPGEAILTYDAKTRFSTLKIDTTGNAKPDFKVLVKGQVTRSDIVA